MNLRYQFVSLAFFLLLSTAAAWGRPANKKALAEYFGPRLADNLNDCRTCHLPDETAREGKKPHNPFGARLSALRRELEEAGKPSGIPARLDAIADEDSDGDGATNLLEILAGFPPGDTTANPSDAELESARGKVAEFRQSRTAYAWQPFDKVERPGIPAIKSTDWARNPIDPFIAAEQESRGLAPRPEAPRSLLIRRLYLDLVGLLPTRGELQAAAADTAPDWEEKLVDKLLASPRYGERWGRHWMDVWRYSDWYGYAGVVRHSQPHMWRYRDWIVESLNQDKGYDQMIVEMLAGDELAADDPQVVRATGFLARNFHALPNTRDKWLQETVDHTSQAFLGLTMGCARCHDHMYDPLTHQDYYQFRAFFEPYRVRIDTMPGSYPRIDLSNGYFASGNGIARAFDEDVTKPTYLFLRGDENTPDKSASLPPGVPAALGGKLPEIVPVKLSPAVYDPEKRPIAVEEVVATSALRVTQTAERLAKATGEPSRRLAEADLAIAEARHAALLAALEAERLEDAGQIDSDPGRQSIANAARAQRRQSMAEAGKNLVVAKLELASPITAPAAAKKIETIEQAIAKLAAEDDGPPSTTYVKRPIKSYPRESTGRRLALARWIANVENPLTARVAVNHLWLRHLGQGFVSRSFDFGRAGSPPTHPALLDWLASELMKGDAAAGQPAWSMKRMHRLMVTSATYRLASTSDPSSMSRDPDNRYYWRTPARRMEAEVVRDSLFHLSGTLDFRMGGPELPHAQGLTLPRRSIYFRHAQEHQMEFLKTFDTASVIECYERVTSVAPHQALALSHSDLAISHGRLAARALHQEIGPAAEDFVVAAFELTLARQPSDTELAACRGFLEEQAKLYRANSSATADATGRQPAPDSQLRARENLLGVLINHNDFVTIR
ncbi:MAG: DUF1549 and DUF1553 domain-containing protein [Pirellulaceae bacterium]|nr:DUF1549 and DUF1553 domain-containing protein [Pirellulaceae bacterium]